MSRPLRSLGSEGQGLINDWCPMWRMFHSSAAQCPAQHPPHSVGHIVHCTLSQAQPSIVLDTINIYTHMASNGTEKYRFTAYK